MGYLRQFIVIMLVGLAAAAGLGGSVAAAAALGAEEYKEFVVRASLSEPKEPVQHVSVDAAGSVALQNQPINIAAQCAFDLQRKPVLAKGIFKLIFKTQSTTNELQLPFYMEEKPDHLMVYWFIDGKWTKKKIPVPKMTANANAESVRRSIKSVSLVSEDKDTYVFEVVANQKDNQETFKALSTDERLKSMLGLLTDDFKYKVTVDKKNCTITKMSFNLADMIAKFAKAIGQVLKVPDAEKEGFDKILASIKFTVDIGFFKSDVAPPILIPAEALAAALQVDTVGYVDMQRVMAESPAIKSLMAKIDAKRNELSEQLAKEKDALSGEEYAERKAALDQELAEYKKSVRSEMNELIVRAMLKVKDEKKLTEISVEKIANFLVTVIDVTDDVIGTIESAAE